MNINELIGKKFGKWTIVGDAPRNKHGHQRCTVKCSCGKIGITTTTYVLSGKSTQCKSCSSRIPPYESLYHLLQRSAKKKGIGVQITYHDFLTFATISQCSYCKGIIEWVPFLKKVDGKSIHRYNLDRKDNSKGYTKDNCVVCCSRCNKIKNDEFTSEEMMSIGPFVRKIVEQRK